MTNPLQDILDSTHTIDRCMPNSLTYKNQIAAELQEIRECVYRLKTEELKAKDQLEDLRLEMLADASAREWRDDR